MWHIKDTLYIRNGTKWVPSSLLSDMKVNIQFLVHTAFAVVFYGGVHGNHKSIRLTHNSSLHNTSWNNCVVREFNILLCMRGKYLLCRKKRKRETKNTIVRNVFPTKKQMNRGQTYTTTLVKEWGKAYWKRLSSSIPICLEYVSKSFVVKKRNHSIERNGLWP